MLKRWLKFTEEVTQNFVLLFSYNLIRIFHVCGTTD